MPVEIIEQSKLRRHLTAEKKLAIVKASYAADVTVAEIARKYNIGLSTLIKWRKYALEGSLMSVKENTPPASAAEVKKLKKEVQQLQKLLGKKSLQIEILQEAVELAREKKLISQQPFPWENDIASD